jgi:hypothetical protein
LCWSAVHANLPKAYILVVLLEEWQGKIFFLLNVEDKYYENLPFYKVSENDFKVPGL